MRSGYSAGYIYTYETDVRLSQIWKWHFNWQRYLIETSRPNWLKVIDTSLISETALHDSQTRTRPTSTHIGWRVKKNFPETFTTPLEKNKNVIHRPGSVRIVRNSVPTVLVPPSAYGLQRYSRPWAQFLPIRTSQPVNNIIIWIYSCRNRWSADKYHITVSRA